MLFGHLSTPAILHASVSEKREKISLTLCGTFEETSHPQCCSLWKERYEQVNISFAESQPPHHTWNCVKPSSSNIHSCSIPVWLTGTWHVFTGGLPRSLGSLPTLHTADFTLHTAGFTLHTYYFTLHTFHFTLLISNCTLLITHCWFHTVNLLFHTAHFSFHTADFTLHTYYFTLHTFYFTLTDYKFTLHAPCFILHTAHYTLDTLRKLFVWLKNGHNSAQSFPSVAPPNTLQTAPGGSSLFINDETFTLQNQFCYNHHRACRNFRVLLILPTGDAGSFDIVCCRSWRVSSDIVWRSCRVHLKYAAGYEGFFWHCLQELQGYSKIVCMSCRVITKLALWLIQYIISYVCGIFYLLFFGIFWYVSLLSFTKVESKID